MLLIVCQCPLFADKSGFQGYVPALRLSIQSLLCANPLQNEPGHEHETGSDCDLYSATWLAIVQPATVGHAHHQKSK